MKVFLLFIGWSGLIGGVIDSLISIYAAAIVGVYGEVGIGLSVDALFRDHISFLYPIKMFAYYLMRDELVTWIFALPALLLFPIRVAVSAWIGRWAFQKAKAFNYNASITSQ